MKKRFSILIAIMALLFSAGKSGAQTLDDAIRLMQSEQFPAAKNAFTNVITKEPKNGDAYFYYGQCYLFSYIVDSLSYTLKEVEDSAQALYKKGTQVDPYNPLNYAGLGKIELLRKNPTQAKVNFDLAISKLPSKENKQSTVPIAKQALTYAKIAEAYAQMTPPDIKQAYAYLQLAQNLNVQDPAIFIIAGDVYLTDGDASNAIANYKKAQELSPSSPLPKIKIGNIYVKGKNLPEALKFFEEAMAIDPEFAPVYRELGELYMKAGKNEKAQENFKKFLDLSNKNIAARIKYIFAIFLCKDYENTLLQIEEVFATDQSSTLLYRLQGYAYFETGKYPEAEKSMNEFFKRMKPERIIGSDYAYMARINAKQSKDSIACTWFDKAIEKDTVNFDVWTEYGNHLSKMKKYPEAVKIFDKKISLEKADPIDYYYESKIYYNMYQALVVLPKYSETDSLLRKGILYLDRADTLCGTFVAAQPNSMQGLVMRSRIKSGLDPDLKTGLAKVAYEKVMEKALTDSAKYQKELIEAFLYMGSYNYFISLDYPLSKSFYDRILAIDPKNEKAKSALALPKFKGLK